MLTRKTIWSFVKSHLSLSHPYRKINSRCIDDLNVKYKTIKILSGKYLYDLRVEKVFLSMELKAETIKIMSLFTSKI